MLKLLGLSALARHVFGRTRQQSLPRFAHEISSFQGIDACLKFFQQNRETLYIPDLRLLVTQVLLCFEQSAPKTRTKRELALGELRRKPEVRKIFYDILRKIDGVPPQEWSHLLGLHVELGLKDKSLFRLAETFILPQMPDLEFPDLVSILDSYALVGCASREFMSTMSRVIQGTEVKHPSLLVSIITSFHVLGYQQSQMLAHLFGPLLEVLPQLNGEEALATLKSYANWPSACDYRLAEGSLYLIKTIQVDWMSSLNLAEVIEVYTSISYFRKHFPQIRGFPDFTARVSREILENFSAVGTEYAAQFIYLAWKWGEPPPDFVLLVAQVEALLCSRIKSLSPRHLGWAFTSVSQVLYRPGAESHQPKVSLMTVAEFYINHRIADFRVKDLGRLLVAYAEVGRGTLAHLQILQSALEKAQLEDVSPYDIAGLFWALAHLNILRTSFFNYLKMMALHRLDQFEVSQLIDILFACCVKKEYDLDFLEQLLDLLDAPRILTDNPACALLYPVILDLVRHFEVSPKKLRDQVDRFLRYSQSAFEALQTEDPVNQAFKSRVVTALASFGERLPHLQGATPIDGWMVDHLIKPEVVLLLHDKTTLHWENHHPLGLTNLKIRYLRHRNFRVLHLPEYLAMDREEACLLSLVEPWLSQP